MGCEEIRESEGSAVTAAPGVAVHRVKAAKKRAFTAARRAGLKVAEAETISRRVQIRVVEVTEMMDRRMDRLVERIIEAELHRL
jgi:hypothetical protein